MELRKTFVGPWRKWLIWDGSGVALPVGGIVGGWGRDEAVKVLGDITYYREICI